MTYNFNEIERVVRHALVSYRYDPKFDDAVQEALIRAWKDIESGEMEDFHHVVNRAKVWARSFLQKPYARATGSPALSRDGTTTRDSEAKREKIQSYIHEFRKLHERKPSATEISQATGIPKGTVRNYVVSINTGNYDHTVYEVEGKRRRVASSYFAPASIELPSIEQSGKIADWGFEEGVVSSLDFNRMLSLITKESAQILYLSIIGGYSNIEIARTFGWSAHQISRRMPMALEEAKAVLFPDMLLVDMTKSKTHCRNGHERTEENTYVWNMAEGRTRRTCKTCMQMRQPAKNEARRRGRAPRTHCYKGHELTEYDKSNRLYCPLCKSHRKAGGKRALTDDQVRAIRAEYKKDGYRSNSVALAEKYGVTKATINNIINGNRYGDVT